MTRILPIDFTGPELKPVNSDLHFLAQEFCRKEFGRELRLQQLMKVWVSVRENEVIGIIGIQNKIDVPMFHLADPENKSRESVEEFLRNNDALIDRAINFVLDNGGSGSEVFVHVHPTMRGPTAVKRNLKRLNARASNRVMINI